MLWVHCPLCKEGWSCKAISAHQWPTSKANLTYGFNNILKNIPIMWEDVGMAEDIYVPSVPHLQGKTVHQKIQNVEPIIVPNYSKGILDGYNKVTLCCDIMHINGIVFLNTISWHIMFTTGIMIKSWQVKIIEDVFKQFNNLYLQHGLKTTRINANRKFELIRAEMAELGISLNCASKKEYVPDIEWFNRTVK